MTGSHPTALAAHEAEFGAAPEDRQAVARLLLESHDKLPPEQQYDLQPGDRRRLADATATSLMDLYRCTGSPEVFEALVRLTTPELERRVHARVRYLGNRIDPQEILQDTFVNIYRYPDRFDIALFHAIVNLLQAIVIPQDNGNRQVEFDAGNHFLQGKHEATITDEGNHRRLRHREFGADGAG